MNQADIYRMNDMAMKLLAYPNMWNADEVYLVDLILRISNIYYNNTSLEVLPLSDGVYDQLLTTYKMYNPNFQVGAQPIQFEEQNTVVYQDLNDKKLLYHTVSDKKLDSALYARDIQSQYSHKYNIGYPMVRDINDELISKRMINTKHKYPELVGTLDKCKFVLNHDAQLADAYNNPSVKIFERDFIANCLGSSIIHPNEVFEMVGELKYDGISIEAEVLGDQIISAYSRGDTGENIATDLTPILKYYRFYNAVNVPKDAPFGIKFEAVITKRNLELMAKYRGKEYKNGRNAIIGLFGSSDAFKYVDFITLIPLSTSLNMNRVDELIFLNTYYSTTEYNRYCVFRGNYVDILYQVKQFTESAEVVRPILPYMIDGVVISFIDPYKIQSLGRVNSVNKYQMAIKFNPSEVRSIFTGYSYSMGKSGEIIPMVHFNPVEFIGTIHTKQTIHSLQRFRELALIKGQEIDITYVNDVLTYVTKPDTEHNRKIAREYNPEPFIEYCPYCGSKIEISDTGKTARCGNVNCHERRIMRMVDMVDRLGFKDIAEETIRQLDLTSFVQLMNPYEMLNLSSLGDITLEKFMHYILTLKNTPIEDYKIMAALSFEGMAEEKWKKVLNNYDIKLLLSLAPEQLLSNLTQISGIGQLTVKAIIEGFINYYDEISCALNNLKIIDSKSIKQRPKVALTGTRDPFIIDIINECGYDCSDKYGVTKDIAFLITDSHGSTSGKMTKAKKYNKPIYTFEEFCKLHNINLQTF